MPFYPSMHPHTPRPGILKCQCRCPMDGLMSSCSALYLNCGRSTRWSREGTFESTALGSSVNVLRASTFGFFEADLAVEDDCFFRLSDFSILRLLSFGSLPRIN